MMPERPGSIDGKRFVTMRFKRIKTWGHVYHVRRHNTREMSCPHVDGPPPKRLIGGSDVAGAIRGVLNKYGVVWKPGEVLALEYVVSASREVFESVDSVERQRRLAGLIMRTFKAFEGRFAIAGQIVSATLHEDETTPHLHIVVVPLIREPDRRRRDKTPTVRLSAKRVVGGRGDMAREQTRFAAFFTDMGLVRGNEGSRARHVPNREHEAMLEQARKAALTEAKAAAIEREDIARERQQNEQNRALWRGFSHRMAKKGERLDQRAARLDAEWAANQAKAERLSLLETSLLEREAKAEELKRRALSRIKALAPVLTEARAFRQEMRIMAIEQRTAVERRAEAAAMRVEKTERSAVNDDEWLAAYLAKQAGRSSGR